MKFKAGQTVHHQDSFDHRIEILGIKGNNYLIKADWLPEAYQTNKYLIDTLYKLVVPKEPRKPVHIKFK